MFIGRTEAEAETPKLWRPHEKSWLIEKDPDAGRDWGQEEKGATEDEMAGWHHRVWVDSGSWWSTGRPGMLWFMGPQSQTWLSDWTELNWLYLLSLSSHSSLTRDWTQALAVKVLSPNKWIARDFPELHILIEIWFVELLCNPLNCSPPGSSVPGLLQARILERVAMDSSRVSSWARDQTYVSCTGWCILYPLTPPGKTTHT